VGLQFFYLSKLEHTTNAQAMTLLAAFKGSYSNCKRRGLSAYFNIDPTVVGEWQSADTFGDSFAINIKKVASIRLMRCTIFSASKASLV